MSDKDEMPAILFAWRGDETSGRGWSTANISGTRYVREDLDCDGESLVSADAECTWGEGPDVLVRVNSLNKSGYPLMRFTETGTASFGLTANEAIQLASQLLSAASRACEMNEAAAEAGKEETDEIGQ